MSAPTAAIATAATDARGAGQLLQYGTPAGGWLMGVCCASVAPLCQGTSCRLHSRWRSFKRRRACVQLFGAAGEGRFYFLWPRTSRGVVQCLQGLVRLISGVWTNCLWTNCLVGFGVLFRTHGVGTALEGHLELQSVVLVCCTFLRQTAGEVLPASAVVCCLRLPRPRSQLFFICTALTHTVMYKVNV